MTSIYITITCEVEDHITDDEISGAAAAAEVQIAESNDETWEGANGVATYVRVVRDRVAKEWPLA